MSTHDPTGQHAAIHSVVVSPKLKGQGVATALLQEYLKRLRANPRYTSAVLISHDNLIPLYQRAGFTLRGKSHVVHGSLPWFELAADVSAAAPAKPAQPAVVSPGRSYSEFQQNDLVDTQGKNRHALYCPRGACKCLLLNPGAAVLVERTYAPVSVSVRVLVIGLLYLLSHISSLIRMQSRPLALPTFLRLMQPQNQMRLVHPRHRRESRRQPTGVLNPPVP